MSARSGDVAAVLVCACGDDAGLDWLDCITGLDRPQFIEALNTGEPGDCIDAADAWNAMCE